jgi:high-affinity Fe2+/Pb2+ permease
VTKSGSHYLNGYFEMQELKWVLPGLIGNQNSPTAVVVIVVVLVVVVVH